MTSEISAQDYLAFKTFLQEACGILLGDNKQYLVTSRLRRIMADEELKSLGQLVEKLRRQPRGPLREAVIDAMTTNETLWFRDLHPFRILEQRLLPELVTKKGSQPLRIWSAACSTGQEPYSIAMTIEEFRKVRAGQLRQNVQIVATDISRRVLEGARKGEYEMLAIGRGLSPERQRQYFSPAPSGGWVINPNIRSMVDFKEINLLERYTLGRFDIIFCRNVLIYFSAEDKRNILERMHQSLNPGGYLILGASESLNGLPDKYEMVQCQPGIIYRAK
ncbi:protein-glutamate O-methyltransferase CheR [Hydrocarboniclastica marina]|uniref:Chemotaxis protein methyltransferase n=2 Tax=Hydrocarboniclastica marina TaxID=2259620 RepID=A0A4V1D8P6_9ALTE|nr:protein-glutamate O-methyltransferase CheR [Hydrocarboniclastica marina]QCF25920.1 protein-glutamate O-methyltransferase CheR [Hydrocarboniclastica marina]